MPRLLVRNARIVTMDADRRELDGDVLVEDGVIAAVGPRGPADAEAPRCSTRPAAW